MKNLKIKAIYTGVAMFGAAVVYPDAEAVGVAVFANSPACKTFASEHIPARIQYGLVAALPMSAYAYGFTGNESWKNIGKAAVATMKEESERRYACLGF